MSGGFRISELRVVREGRGDQPAIGPISFELGQGSALGIVGETGAGKTMTLRALMGLPPAGFAMEGCVELELGTAALCDAAALRSELGRRIGVVLQNPFTSFDPLKSVGSQIVEGVLRRKIMNRADAEARARSLLQEMGFGDDGAVLRLFPHQLSGGMAQRVSIAMAVMQEPPVVLADEPTSALDATLRTGVLELLRRFIDSTGAALVIVSHDLGLIAGFCQGLIVMYGGRVVEAGPAADLLGRPTHPYTKALIECTPSLGGDSRRRLASIPGSAVSLFTAGEGCRYAPRCPFVMDVCHAVDPPLQPHRGIQVACHLVDKAAVSR